MNWETLQRLADEEIETTIENLPHPLRKLAKQLPVSLERVPNAELQADGIEADTLELFTGAKMVDEDADVLPSQIILFVENIWNYA